MPTVSFTLLPKQTRVRSTKLFREHMRHSGRPDSFTGYVYGYSRCKRFYRIVRDGKVTPDTYHSDFVEKDE